MHVGVGAMHFRTSFPFDLWILDRTLPWTDRGYMKFREIASGNKFVEG